MKKLALLATLALAACAAVPKGEYLLIEANARRQLYIPKWYTIQ